MTPDQLHNLATAAGAMVLGDPGTRQQYMLDLVQLARLVELLQTARVGTCPVPLPKELS